MLEKKVKLKVFAYASDDDATGYKDNKARDAKKDYLNAGNTDSQEKIISETDRQETSKAGTNKLNRNSRQTRGARFGKHEIPRVRPLANYKSGENQYQGEQTSKLSVATNEYDTPFFESFKR